MRLIGSLIDHLQRWIARYKVTLDYAHTRARREPTHEIEWNRAMIGDLRRRSSDAAGAILAAVSCGRLQMFLNRPGAIAV
jgi:hypothetical protein